MRLGLGLFTLGLLVAVAAAAQAAGAADGASTDRVLAVVDLEAALKSPALMDVPCLVLSPEEAMVLVEGGDGAASAQALIGLVGGRLVGRVPSRPLWIASGLVGREVAEDLGLDIVYATGRSTLFAADRNSAYRLLELGHFIVEADFTPLGMLARPAIGPALIEKLLRDRPITAERARFLERLVGPVDTARVDAALRFLAYDETATKDRSRFAPRWDLKRDITPYIYSTLASFVVPEGGTVTNQEFEVDLPDKYKGEDSVFTNVVARKPGRKTGAHFIVCAHYDAIASRESAWQEAGAWKTLAAPGADDNATGVAAIFEVARLIAPLALDVGVTFIAFSGEELGLLGSQAFADEIGTTDSILAVINLDMLGYAKDEKTITLTYDGQSRWLSDLLAGAASDLGLDAEVRTYDGTGIYNSDHASFWSVGVPGVMVADEQNANGTPRYPYYHRVDDRPDSINIGQVCDNAGLVVGWLGHFADVQADTCDLSLSPASIEWRWPGKSYLPLLAGDSLELVVRAANLGGSMLEPAAYRFQVWRGDSTGRVVFADTVTLEVLAGEYAQVGGSWKTDESEYGALAFTIALTPLGADLESDIADNWIETRLDIMPGETVLANLHVYPNPVEDPRSANLRFDIWLPKTDLYGDVELWVYDLEGTRVGHTLLANRHTSAEKPLAIGANTVSLSSLLADADLAPGIYVCFAELTVTGQAGRASAKSKFAVAR